MWLNVSRTVTAPKRDDDIAIVTDRRGPLQSAALMLASVAAVLCGCASVETRDADATARARSPEMVCRAVSGTPTTGRATRAEIQAEASAAARRGELDPICRYL